MPALPRPRPGQFPRIWGPLCWSVSARRMSGGLPRRPPTPPQGPNLHQTRRPVCPGGDHYAPVNTPAMDLGDHQATLCLPGGKTLIIATPMVA